MMTWTDLSRRAATVFLVVLCLLTVPAVASAKFVSPQTVSLSDGTARMDTPTGVHGSYVCFRNAWSEYVTVSVNGFSDDSPTGTAYSYSLMRGDAVEDTVSTTARSAILGDRRENDNNATTWTVRVQSSLHRWTGGVAAVTITCPRTSTRFGTF
jgi:hypothetical protein